MEIRETIQRLKKEQDAVILAHYYVRDEVQEMADYIGDSFYLSKLAVDLPQKTLVVCGVSFMGESAKILNPGKRVLLPDPKADCAMAHMITPEKVAALRQAHPKAAVVCYINSTAELKTCSPVPFSIRSTDTNSATIFTSATLLKNSMLSRTAVPAVTTSSTMAMRSPSLGL